MHERKPPQPPRKTTLDRIGSFFDRLVYAFAPVAGAKRMVVRSTMDRAKVSNTASEAGRNDETRMSSWMSSRLSPDSALEQDIETQRRKSRELYLNDSIGGAVDSRKGLVVSYGFTPQSKILAKPGLVTEKEAELYNAELEEIYNRAYPCIGKDGQSSIWEAVGLVERHHGFDGESITIMSDRDDEGKPIPLCLEVVDPERMETPPEHVGNPRIRMGIEHDASGKIIAYHIRNTHPGDTATADQSYTRYPAARVIHIFEKWFAGQTRAYSWLIRTINRCKDTKDLDDAMIALGQVASCFAGFEIAPAGTSGILSAQQAGTPSGDHRTQDLVPGTIRHVDGLGAGGDMKFSTPPTFNGYADFQEHNDRRKAAGLNYPYEMVAKKWNGLSFAAGRLSLTDAKLFCKAQQKRLRESWFARIWQRVVEQSVMFGVCSIRPAVYQRAPWWFQRHIFSDPAWPYSLTPMEEMEAGVLAIEKNIRSKGSFIAENGGNIDDVFAEREWECKQERERKIDLTTAPAAANKLTPQEMEKVAA